MTTSLHTVQLQEENRQLRQENTELRQENERLRQALAVQTRIGQRLQRLIRKFM